MPAGFNIRKHRFVWGTRTYVMGILNLTPDSFSGDGLLSFPDPLTYSKNDAGLGTALDQAKRFLSAGVDIIDIGGESTRPGAQSVSADEENARVIPLIEALRAETDAPISIDTYKAAVAEAAIKTGADIVNDVWGLRADPQIAAVVARYKVPVIIMHNRSKPNNAEVQAQLGGHYTGIEYENLIEDVKRELLESVAIARSAGVAEDQIVLDPGIGFGKTVEQNLELVNRLAEIKSLGFPLLLGPSRKSFIGYTLNLPPEDRLEGTAAAVAVGITRGADIVRVHDVEAMLRVARMTDAIIRQKA
jgi:dihydropteroate synthase